MVSGGAYIGRRNFLRGKLGGANANPPTSQARFLYIASAIIVARPELIEQISRCVGEMPLTEVRAIEGWKLIVVMESFDDGEIGRRLLAISRMEGVFAANLVFEQIEPVRDPEISDESVAS